MFRCKVWWWKFGLCFRMRIGLIYHTSHNCVIFCFHLSSWLQIHIWLGLGRALCLAVFFFDWSSRTTPRTTLHNLSLIGICLLLWNTSIGSVMCRFDSVLTETFDIKGFVELVAHSVFVIQWVYAILWNIGVWVFFAISSALWVAYNTLLCHSVDPELTRFELPFVRIVSTRVNILASCLDFKDGVILYSACSFEKMWLLRNDFFLLVQFLSG